MRTWGNERALCSAPYPSNRVTSSAKGKAIFRSSPDLRILLLLLTKSLPPPDGVPAAFQVAIGLVVYLLLQQFLHDVLEGYDPHHPGVRLCFL